MDTDTANKFRLPFPNKLRSMVRWLKISLPLLMTTGFAFVFFTIQNTGKIIKEYELSDIMVPIDPLLKGPYTLEQNDPQLLKLIRREYLIPPSGKSLHLMQEKIDPSQGQTKFIRKILQNKTNGIFVEAGGFDGETRSNSLMFETHFGWTGLLIEGNPNSVSSMLSRNRNAWISPVAVSTVGYPVEKLFLLFNELGNVREENIDSAPVTTPVQCMPLYSILLAMNATTVDYLSLDVEGSELAVLKTVPFRELKIATISIEFIHGNQTREQILDLMTSYGYELYIADPEDSDLTIQKNRIFAIDLILYHPNHLKEALKNDL